MTKAGSRHNTRGVRLLIALAIAGLIVPPWPGIGPASRASASQTSRMSAELPRVALRLMARAGHWISSQAVARNLVPSTPGRPIPADGPPPAPDQAGETAEFPIEADELAEPLARVELIVRNQGESPTPTCRRRSDRRDVTRLTSAGRLRSRMLTDVRPPLDVSVDLCRLTC